MSRKKIKKVSKIFLGKKYSLFSIHDKSVTFFYNGHLFHSVADALLKFKDKLEEITWFRYYYNLHENCSKLLLATKNAEIWCVQNPHEKKRLEYLEQIRHEMHLISKTFSDLNI
jgi:hypothetical protein